MTPWERIDTKDGHYFIDNGRLTMELIYDMPSTPFTNFIRFEGGISSDSVLYLDSKTDTWCEDVKPRNSKFSFERVYYKIYKTDVRPDSSRIWFRETSWYKNNVWYNQPKEKI